MFRKNRTAILYIQGTDETWEPLFFGDAAVLHRFTPFPRPTFFVDNFKMLLHTDDSADEWTFSKTPEEVLVDYLAMVFACTHAQAKGVASHDWIYVFTVPVKSTSDKIRCIKQAIRRAGAFRGRAKGTTTLTIISEAVAAIHHTFGTLIGEDRQNVPKGRILILDPGGGSTEVSVHEMSDKESYWTLQEVAVESGIHAGGTTIDAEFFAAITEECGPAWDRFLAATDTDGESTMASARGQSKNP